MLSDLPLFPQRASTMAAGVDHLYFFLLAVASFFCVLIFGLVFVFSIKYRRRSPSDRATQIPGSLPLELLWSIVPLGISMVMFFWGANLYFQHARPPAGAQDIYVVGKQWMWKLQHPEGRREINELHVPVGRPFRLILASEDVIHSFYVPAFRIKQDAVPGRYTTEWFEATRPGQYHFFCSQYCGTNHALMNGWVYVMEPVAYQRWLSGTAGEESMPAAGEKLFQSLGCASCHHPDGGGRGPSMVGLFGKKVLLEGGRSVVADESYIRECVLNPASQRVAGYQPIMPTFQGQISEEGLLQIVAYIKSLKQVERSAASQ